MTTTKDDGLQAMKDLLERQEELDPDLDAWAEETDTFGRVIKHPLVFSIPHSQTMNAMVNALYEQKKERLAEARAEKRWNTCVFLHERPYRLEALMGIQDELSAEEYWPIVGDVWTDSENVWQHHDEWRDVFTAPLGSREIVMDEEEREALAALPDTLTVYRGYVHETALNGFSWTLDRERAIWFARRYQRTGPRLAEGTVKKEAVIAHFLGRGEQEIVLLPEDIDHVAIGRAV